MQGGFSAPPVPGPFKDLRPELTLPPLVASVAKHQVIDPTVIALEAALRVGAVTADVVAVEARQAAGLDTSVTAPAPAPAATERRVVSLTQRRLADPAAVIAGLPADTRPAPSVTGYDELINLSRHRAASPQSPAKTLIEETA